MANPIPTTIQAFNLGGINHQTNPLDISANDPIVCTNMDPYEFGAKKKRPGYGTMSLTGGDAFRVTSLADWHQNDSSTFYLYRMSTLGILYYSTNGTANWAAAGNGQWASNARLGTVVLENTLLVTDSYNGGTVRHTTSGTSFTDTSGAPQSVDLVEYQNRIWAAGTSSNLFYSTSGTPTDWTTDSSSIAIPGAGKMLSAFKSQNRLIASKNSGIQFSWDGNFLEDMATNLGPTARASVAEISGVKFGANRLGIFSYSASAPQIVSNPVQKFFYNDAGSATTNFGSAPGVVHQYNYYLGLSQNVSDDVSGENLTNGVIKYNYQLNQLSTYDMGTQPQSFCSFVNNSGVQTLIFGDASGFVYQVAGTATTDNGAPIQARMRFLLHANTLNQKNWRWIKLMFSPGCQAKVQAAFSDSFQWETLNWIDLGDAKSGEIEFHFPSGARSVFMHLRIYEASRATQFRLYGYEVDAQILPRP